MENSDVLFFELGSAIGLFIIALVGSSLPLIIYSGGGRSLLFQLGSMFSGGVMLSAGLVHLLADSLEVLMEEIEYPLGPFLCACGFLVTLIVDQFAEQFVPHSHPHAGIGARSQTLPTDAASSQLTEEETDEKREEEPFLSIFTAVLLAAALCLHSVLEGLALGTQKEIESGVGILVAIAAHKAMAAYALGVCVIDSHTTKFIFWMIMLIFCLATPVGVIVGYIIAEFSDSAVSSGLSALAAGTFLYVTLMEVIPNELKMKGHRIPKLCALLLGFGLMSMIAIWV